MDYLRNAQNEQEKALVLKCYKTGMSNAWASGKVDKAEGNYIVEEDRLNQNSIGFCDSEEKLKAFFRAGNWCLGQGVIFGNMFFLQQVNGGDEWATWLIANNEIASGQFESLKHCITLALRNLRPLCTIYAW